MAQSKPKSRFNGLALVLLLCLASVATVLSESIETAHKTDELDNGGHFPRGTKKEERAASARELFWVNNKHLPEWQDFKYQQRIQRKRKRRRRNMNGPFKKPNRWNGTGFRMERMNVTNRMNMRMNMNMMGMNMKKRMNSRKMMNTTNTNLNFQPIMTRGMMKMRPMRANTRSSDEERSDAKHRMELTWDELAERRMNMRKRANRRFKRRQWRMQQRRNENNEQEYGSDDYSKADSDSSSSSSAGSSR